MQKKASNKEHEENNEDISNIEPAKYPFGNFSWIFGLPMQLYQALIILSSPLRAIIWILEGIVSAIVVGICITIYAWWTKKIPDEYVSWFLNELGGRLINIMHQAGIF